jgi:hypothetical protein
MSQPHLPSEWWPETIRIIVEEGLTPLPGETNGQFVIRANTLAGYNTPEEDVKAASRSRMWREHLDAAMKSHYVHLYQTVAQDKAIAVGRMTALSMKLERQGKTKDALDGLASVIKAEGAIDSDSLLDALSGTALQKALTEVRERKAVKVEKVN